MEHLPQELRNDIIDKMVAIPKTSAELHKYLKVGGEVTRSVKKMCVSFYKKYNIEFKNHDKACALMDLAIMAREAKLMFEIGTKGEVPFEDKLYVFWLLEKLPKNFPRTVGKTRSGTEWKIFEGRGQLSITTVNDMDTLNAEEKQLAYGIVKYKQKYDNQNKFGLDVTYGRFGDRIMTRDIYLENIKDILVWSKRGDDLGVEHVLSKLVWRQRKKDVYEDAERLLNRKLDDEEKEEINSLLREYSNTKNEQSELQSEEWAEYLTEGNYHSYDDYPMEEQIRIWEHWNNKVVDNY